MTHKRLSILITSTAVIIIGIVAHCRAETVARPNIILIMCDDMGFSDIGCYGGEVMTPNLDGLAREGMRVTQFYNNAKCTTTRASLVTGLYPRFGGPHLCTNMVTLGEALGDAVYLTALCGKWHLGHGETMHPFTARPLENRLGQGGRKTVGIVQP